ncbi:MAG TPA: hypothetical protein VK358_00385 [Longimicrobium sp.]|nr:hypothetical protein [Longimicrobium sp.]
MSDRRDAFDEVLDELYEVRRRIWDECDRDLDTYFARQVELMEQLRRDGWKFAPPPPVRDKSAA